MPTVTFTRIMKRSRSISKGKYRGMRRARAYPLFPSLDGWPRGLGAGRPDKVTETRPEDVIKFVDNMGLESTVLYPTAGLAIGLVQNPEWACSIARAYNNWFHARYIKKDSRLKGVAMLPVQDPQGAVEELRYAVEKLDMVGAFLPSATVMNKAFGHPDFHPIFREAEETWMFPSEFTALRAAVSASTILKTRAKSMLWSIRFRS